MIRESLETVVVAIGAVASFGGLLAGAGYGYGKFREGKAASNASTLELLRNELTALQEVVKQQEGRMLAQEKEISYLKGQLDEKDKKIKEYTQIFQGRNPNLEKVLEDIRNFMIEINNHMKVTQRVR